MRILLLTSTVLIVLQLTIAESYGKNLSPILVQALQKQLETCMDQNAELVKRTCNEGNNNSEPSKRHPVAFHFGLNHHVRDLPSNAKLVFNKMYLNEGNAYNAKTGIFTCPVDGVYVFHWTIMTTLGNYFYTDFMVNGHVVGRSHPNSKSVNRAASSSVVQRLKKGDHVWIEPHAGYIGQFAYAGYTFFSGYKL